MAWENGTWTDYLQCNGSLTDILECTNTNTNNLFGLGILIALWFILFVSISQKDMEMSLAVSTFVTTIVAFVMASADLIPDPIAIGFLLGTIGSVILLMISSRRRSV